MKKNIFLSVYLPRLKWKWFSRVGNTRKNMGKEKLGGAQLAVAATAVNIREHERNRSLFFCKSRSISNIWFYISELTQGLSYATHKVTLSSQFIVDVSSCTCSIADLHICFLRLAMKRLLPKVCTYSVHFMVISASHVKLCTSSITFLIAWKVNTYCGQSCAFCTSWSTTLADVCTGDGANVKLYRHASLWYRFSSQHLQLWNVVVHKKSKNQSKESPFIMYWWYKTPHKPCRLGCLLLPLL